MSSGSNKIVIARISMENSENTTIANSLIHDQEIQIDIREVENLKPPRCFFFVNDKFKNYADRNCANEDIELIREGLRMFYIEPEVLKNNNKQDILNKMKEIENINFTDYSGIMIIISSHGGLNDNISACDAEYNLHTDIISSLIKNPTLKNKVKIFIIQACKGKSYPFWDATGNSEICQISEESYMNALEKSLQNSEKSENEPKPELPTDFNNYGHENNLIIAYSTFEGFCSLRELKAEGSSHSVFLKVFSDYLIKYGQTKSVYDILNLMRNPMRIITKEIGREYNSKIEQTPMIISYGTASETFTLQDYVSRGYQEHN